MSATAIVGYHARGGRGLAERQRHRRTITPVDAALQAYAAEVAALRSEGLIRGVPGDVAERFFALGFSLEQMRQNLNDLDRCHAEWCETAPAVKPGTVKSWLIGVRLCAFSVGDLTQHGAARPAGETA